MPGCLLFDRPSSLTFGGWRGLSSKVCKIPWSEVFPGETSAWEKSFEISFEDLLIYLEKSKKEIGKNCDLK